MADYASLEETLVDSLQLKRRPVAIAFLDAPIEGVPRLEGSQPAGCAFWSKAAEGHAFYTVPADHYNCPVGSYTLNIPLPADREHELTDVLGVWKELGYLRLEEVRDVPRLPKTPAIMLYAPLAETPVAPDGVVVCGSPAGLMVLHEAATRLGARPPASLLGRPTCMAIPAALAAGVASSLGCVGNRVYTGLSDKEFYSVVRGADLEDIVGEITTIAAADVLMTEYHRGRRASLAT